MALGRLIDSFFFFFKWSSMSLDIIVGSMFPVTSAMLCHVNGISAPIHLPTTLKPLSF